MVGVVEVEMVGAEAAEARLDLIEDVSPRQAALIGPPAHRLHDLRAQHDVAPARADGTPDDLLGRRPRRRRRCAGAVEARLVAVAVRGVDEVDAEIERATDQPLGFARKRRHAERRRAQPDARDLYAGAAERAVAHRCSPGFVRAR